MNGTNHSTRGLRRITQWDASIRARLVIFAVVLALGAFWLTGVKTWTWKSLDPLQQEFANIESGRFYLAVRLWGNIRELNDSLLAYHVQQSTTNRDNFLNGTKRLRQWFEEQRGSLGGDASTKEEWEAFQKLEAAYDQYEAGAKRILIADSTRPGQESFDRTYNKLEGETRPVLVAFDQLMKAQSDAFDDLVEHTELKLFELQSPLKVSVVLLWVLVIFLVVLGYRGMITPLRSRLSESRVLIQRQEKLASLGVLAAGVAHEIRNPLTAIKFRLFSLNKSLPQAAENEDAKVISGEIDRLDRIVKDFLQFARPSDPKLVGLPAERILQQVHDLLQSDLEKQAIELKIEPSGATWVQADPQQIEQVLINLIQNSADSIGQGGTITLGVREGNAGLGGQIRPVVILEVTDTGKGIPPDVEKRLFDPFFTTKDGGTGLGLAISARIVEKHGGMLRHQTKVNRGTTFEIVLPKPEPNAS